jgi:hypothetical protein
MQMTFWKDPAPMEPKNWQEALNLIGTKVEFFDGQPGVIAEIIVDRHPGDTSPEVEYKASVMVDGEKYRAPLKHLKPWKEE